MDFIRALWHATTTNAWPAEISIPIVVLSCTVSYAFFGWISIIPIFIISEFFVLFVTHLSLRQYMTPSHHGFFQFLRSPIEPQYSTYQMRSSQIYLPRVLLTNLTIWLLIFHTADILLNLNGAAAFLLSIYITQARCFIYHTVISSVVYFWNPAVSPNEQDISISKSSTINPPEVHQSREFLNYKEIPFDSHNGFRLLLLKSGTKSSPLEGELIAQHTKTISFFTALSYTWDDQPFDRYMICNGKRLAISANCEAALLHLRRRYFGRLLWVDAICIDQTEHSESYENYEKANQLAMMDRIYGHATEVVVWLGDWTRDTEIGFKYVRLWAFVNGLRWIPDSLLGSLRILVAQKIFNRGHQKFIFDIVRRPWFRRVWTLQEITLARPHCVTLYCGNNKMHYDEIIKPLELLMSFLVIDSEIPLSGTTSFRVPLSLRIEMREALHLGVFGDSGNALAPSRILGQIRACEASKDIDKIYALYALFWKIGVQLPPPNYSKSVGEVYWQATTSAMTCEQSLDLLLLVSGRRIKGAPSWVPDFREPISPATYLNQKWAATGNSKAHFLISSDEAILNVRGCVIDIISTAIIAAPWKHPRLDVGQEDQAFLDLKDGFQSTIMGLQLWLYFSYANDKSQYVSPKEKDAACMDVLSRGMVPLLCDNLAFTVWSMILSILHTGKEDNPITLDVLVEKGKKNNTMLWERFFNDPELKHLTEIDEWKILFAIKSATRVAAVQKCVLEMSYGSKIFWTENGYLGQGSAEMCEGDVIALIQGLRMPLILRPAPNDFYSNRYVLVSPAYISGMMKGELWEKKLGQLGDMSLE